MSFIYSQALVEASSLVNCLDTGAFVPSSGSHMPKLSLWHDKTMEASRLSRFGMTCKPLTESHGAELLTSWLAGFRAKTYPLPAEAPESMGSAAECGHTWRGWLAKFDPDSSSWKTAQHSLIEDSGECLATFPRSGMTRGGLLWELPMLERRTSEIGFGFWPTTVASDTSSRNKKYAQGGTPLSLAIKMWPTPNASDATKWSNQSLQERKEKGQQVRLNTAVSPEGGRGGQLNPNWVEWLMGWPIGHTDLKRSETAKCPNALPKPSEFLLEVCE